MIGRGGDGVMGRGNDGERGDRVLAELSWSVAPGWGPEQFIDDGYQTSVEWTFGRRWRG